MSYLDKVIERRDAVKAEMDAVLEAVAEENRTDLTAEETEKVDALVEESRSLDTKIEKLKTQADADAKAAEIRSAVAPVATPVGGARVISEARTYTPEAEASFVKDAYNAQFKNDFAAQERLARHMREEKVENRAVATGKSNTDADDTLLTINVRTVAGQQDISRQAIERGTGIDSFILADLIRSWHTTLDNQCLNGAGTSGTVLGLDNSGGNAITYTSASPTVALLYPKLADAVQQIQTTAFQQPTHWIMHPRRLAYLLAAVDGQNRPLVVPNNYGPMNALAVGAGAVSYGNSGYSLMGLPIITDANVVTNAGAGTNQDKIYCVAAPEMHLWEQAGSPFALNFDATSAGSLTIKSVVYGYAAFSAGRYPAAASIISGTGLVAPTF